MSIMTACYSLALLTSPFLAYSWLSGRKYRFDEFPLPPGPKGLPVIGNLLDMPSKDMCETACQLGETFGDIVYVEILGSRHLFINSYEFAIELLQKRGDIYSGRPRTAMLELGGWLEWNVAMMPLGEEVRKFRQHFNIFFQKSTTKNHHEVQTQSTHKLLLKLIDNPEGYYAHVRHWAAEAIVNITYGFEIDENDTYVELVDQSLQAVSESLALSVVNVLPARTHFHKKIQEGLELSSAIKNHPYKEAKRKIVDGTASPSVTSQLLEISEVSADKYIDEAFIAGMTAIAYTGGGDTTVAALLTFILAMVLYPDAMKKGQEELDTVIGGENLPTFEDRPKLPYNEAICKECLRWQTVAAIGIPHVVEKDDVFNGYFIPAGTTIIANAWAMLRDPKRYPDPEKFIPERWLPSSDRELSLDSTKIAFGFGRRICPGRYFAENAFFIGVASILAALDIQKAVDEHGVPITPSEDYISGLVRHPKPFKCKITTRSDEVVDIIRQAVSAGKW